MKNEHWYYFLALESDFEATTRYVEPCADNYATFSIEYTKILLGVCSEVDVVSKVLCEQIQPGSKPDNIDKYREIITAKYTELHKFAVLLPRYALTLNPWQSWASSTNPTWWRKYNSVKHERHQQFRDANLENCMHALAGLFGLVLFLYHDDLFKLKLVPWAKLLALPSEPGGLVVGKYELPGLTNSSAG